MDHPVVYILIILAIAGLIGRWAESWIDKRVRRAIAEHEATHHEA